MRERRRDSFCVRESALSYDLVTFYNTSCATLLHAFLRVAESIKITERKRRKERKKRTSLMVHGPLSLIIICGRFQNYSRKKFLVIVATIQIISVSRKKKFEPRWFSWLPFNPASLFGRGYESGNFSLRFWRPNTVWKIIIANTGRRRFRGHFPFIMWM